MVDQEAGGVEGEEGKGEGEDVMVSQKRNKAGLGRGRRGRPEGREESKDKTRCSGEGEEPEMVEGRLTSGEEKEEITVGQAGARRSKSATCCIM